MRYFDYETVASEAAIPCDKLYQLRQLTRREFPRGDKMCELHLLRACMAIRDDGIATLEEALKAD